MTPPISRDDSRTPVLLILFATLMASSGTGISIVAFPWLVLQRHGSAEDAALVSVAATVPLVLSTLVAGTAVDFFGRRPISLVSDLLSGAAVAAVPSIAWFFGAGAVDVGVLASSAACTAAFDPAGLTARQSMLPEAAVRAGWSLDRINSVYEATFNLSFLVGPGVGGMMIATVGGITTMWITAGAFGMSLLAMAALRLDGLGRPHHASRPEGLLSGIAEGMRFVWNLKVLRTLGLIELVVSAVYLPMESVLFPKYFADRHQPAQLGWALMALAIGGIVGALGYAVMSRRLSRRMTVLTAVLTFGASTAGIAFLPSLPVILVLSGLVGLVYGPIQPIYNYVMQTRAPHHLRGRVVGAMASLTYAAGPVGLLLAGRLADSAGLKTTFFALAVPILAVGLVACVLPSLRELDRLPELADSPGS